jgi:hypothetical protein
VFHHSVYAGIQRHPTVQMILGAAAMGMKLPGCEVLCMDHSSAEVKNTWSCAYIVPYIFVACCLIKHGGNFKYTSHSISFIMNVYARSLTQCVKFLRR